MATLTSPAPATNAGAGALNLPPRCKPSKVCSTDRSRPTLLHAYLREHKGAMWLCATDSYIAAAIKVDGDGLIEGWVPVGALRLMERGKTGRQVSDTAWRIETVEGAVTFDIAADVRGAMFPRFDDLGMWDRHTDAVAVEVIGMSPRLMAKIGDAIGGNQIGCRFEFAGELRSIRVVPLDADDRIGLQMPVRLRA